MEVEGGGPFNQKTMASQPRANFYRSVVCTSTEPLPVAQSVGPPATGAGYERSMQSRIIEGTASATHCERRAPVRSLASRVWPIPVAWLRNCLAFWSLSSVSRLNVLGPVRSIFDLLGVDDARHLHALCGVQSISQGGR